MSTQAVAQANVKTQRVTLPIYQLGCAGGGALTVERALARTRGVVYVYVNPATEMAYIEFDPALTDPGQLTAAVAQIGFGPRDTGQGSDQYLDSSAMPEKVARKFEPYRLPLAVGLWLAAIYTLCIATDILFPNLFQMYRIWELVLIGFSWADPNPWTVVLGLVEVFLYGVLGTWTLTAIYRAVSES